MNSACRSGRGETDSFFDAVQSTTLAVLFLRPFQQPSLSDFAGRILFRLLPFALSPGTEVGKETLSFVEP